MSWVRARLSSGAEVTANADYLNSIDGIELLDVEATDSRGRPLRATRRNGRRKKTPTTVNKAAAKKAAAIPTASSPVTNNGGVTAESPKEASK